MECFGLCLLCILCWIIKKRKKKRSVTTTAFSQLASKHLQNNSQLTQNGQRAEQWKHILLCVEVMIIFVGQWARRDITCSLPPPENMILHSCGVEFFLFIHVLFFFFCHSHRRGDLISSSSSSHLPTQSPQTPPPHLYFQKIEINFSTELKKKKKPDDDKMRRSPEGTSTPKWCTLIQKGIITNNK